MPISNKKCKYCELPAKINLVNGRNKGYCSTCGSESCLNYQYKDKLISLSKGRKGELNSKWIKDRGAVKKKRSITEEIDFFKEVMHDRGYKCEITGINGKLSVHHINGVWSNPELQYDKSNCIVILNSIHNKFHKIYGNRSNIKDWIEFIENKEYDIPIVLKKRNYSPYKDWSGIKVGRLLVIEKVGKKWLCICDCGTKKMISSSNFKHTKSCGCYKLEVDTNRLLDNPIWVYSPASNKSLIN